MFVAQAQHREDQVLLGAEVLVHRRFRDAGLGDKHVHTGRMKAVSIESLQRFLNQLVAFGWAHRTSFDIPICT